MIKYYYKGQKTTRKFLETTFGTTTVAHRVKEARDTWGRNPYLDCSWPDGMYFVNGNLV